MFDAERGSVSLDDAFGDELVLAVATGIEPVRVRADNMSLAPVRAPVASSTCANATPARVSNRSSYVERSIGKTALLALLPMLHLSNEASWQLSMLEK